GNFDPRQARHRKVTHTQPGDKPNFLGHFGTATWKEHSQRSNQTYSRDRRQRSPSRDSIALELQKCPRTLPRCALKPPGIRKCTASTSTSIRTKDPCNRRGAI